MANQPKNIPQFTTNPYKNHINLSSNIPQDNTNPNEMTSNTPYFGCREFESYYSQIYAQVFIFCDKKITSTQFSFLICIIYTSNKNVFPFTERSEKNNQNGMI